MSKKVRFLKDDMMNLALVMYGAAKWYMGKVIRPIHGRPLSFGNGHWQHAYFDAINAEKDHVALVEWLLLKGAVIQLRADQVLLSVDTFTTLQPTPEHGGMKLALFRAAIEYLNSSAFGSHEQGEKQGAG